MSIIAYEHETLRLGSGQNCLNNSLLEALQKFHGAESDYFSLTHNGIKFKSYVGALQVGDTLIEVLPKIDRYHDDSFWQKMLLGMLRSVGDFHLQAPSNSHLKLKSNSILHLYFELFINEVEYLIHRGLVKKYRRNESNLSSLKGSINFPKSIRDNLLHKERFYVNHFIYDTDHLLNQVIFEALLVLKSISINADLKSRIENLLLFFPTISRVKVTGSLFQKITYNRKSEPYRGAINIAELILRNYHPDISKGHKNVLALMFDMNLLWERFVLDSLLKNKAVGYKLKPQQRKSFWEPVRGSRVSLVPDIIIEHPEYGNAILDTKWKNIGSNNPSPNDLRQLYAYGKYFHASWSALIYPGDESNHKYGQFTHENPGESSNQSCSSIMISVKLNIKKWQKEISNQIFDHYELWFKQRI